MIEKTSITTITPTKKRKINQIKNGEKRQASKTITSIIKSKANKVKNG
jgi:hypothetical protein